MIGGQPWISISRTQGSSQRLCDASTEDRRLIHGSPDRAHRSAASAAQLRAIRAFGERVGLAFQISDDLLNVRSTWKESAGDRLRSCPRQGDGTGSHVPAAPSRRRRGSCAKRPRSPRLAVRRARLHDRIPPPQDPLGCPSPRAARPRPRLRPPGPAEQGANFLLREKKINVRRLWRQAACRAPRGFRVRAQHVRRPVKGSDPCFQVVLFSLIVWRCGRIAARRGASGHSLEPNSARAYSWDRLTSVSASYWGTRPSRSWSGP
jgi:hypothetical protein